MPDASPSVAVLVLGNQLSTANSALVRHPRAPVVMVEARSMCTRWRYHSLKLVLVLAAMRAFADELRAAGREVAYVRLEDAEEPVWLRLVGRELERLGARRLVWMRTSDHWPNRHIAAFCRRRGLDHDVSPNSLFLTEPREFARWAEGRERLVMDSFYRRQRARLDVLMDERGEPEGGRYSFDALNRRPLPRELAAPPLPPVAPNGHVRDVSATVARLFPDHPGDVRDFWLPTTREGSLRWLDAFAEERLGRFGPYQDAMRTGELTLFHAVISPMQNLGLLHPREVVERVVRAYREGAAPLQSVEGFVRQIIGWREYMHGMYHLHMPGWHERNVLGHTAPLPGWWRTGDTHVVPLDRLLPGLLRYGYAHHIERLMVYGNFMLLSRYDPKEVHRWFMEMFVDSYDWVMVSNANGMSQYADGGLVATKPYIGSATYLQRMGRFWPASARLADSEYSVLFWDFLRHHRARFEENPRMRQLYRLLDQRGG